MSDDKDLGFIPDEDDELGFVADNNEKSHIPFVDKNSKWDSRLKGAEDLFSIGQVDEYAGGVQSLLDTLAKHKDKVNKVAGAFGPPGLLIQGLANNALPEGVTKTPNQVNEELLAQGFTGDLDSTYISARNDSRQEFKDAENANPEEYFQGQLAGGALSMFAPLGVGKMLTAPFGVAKASVAAQKAANLANLGRVAGTARIVPEVSLLAKTGMAAANAAPGAALVGYGKSESKELPDQAMDVATSVGIGSGLAGGITGGLGGAGKILGKTGQIAGDLFPSLKDAYQFGERNITSYADKAKNMINEVTEETVDPIVKFFNDKKNVIQGNKKKALVEVDKKISSLQDEVNTKNVDRLNEIENQINNFKQLRDELSDEYKTKFSAEKQAQVENNVRQVEDVRYKLNDAKVDKHLTIDDEVANIQNQIKSLDDDYKYQLEQAKNAQLSNNQKQLTLAEEKTREVANKIQKATDETLDKLGLKYNDIDAATEKAGVKFNLKQQIRGVLDNVKQVNPEAHEVLEKQFQPYLEKPDLTIDEIRTIIGRAEESANKLRTAGSVDAARKLMAMRRTLREAQVKTYEDAGMKNIADDMKATNAQYSKTVNYKDYLSPNEVTKQLENQNELIRKVKSFENYDPTLPLHESNQFINELSQALPEQAEGIISQAKNVGQELKTLKNFKPDESVVQRPDVSELKNNIAQLKQAKKKASLLPGNSQAKQYQDLINEYQAQLNSLSKFKPDVSSKVLSPDADILGLDTKINELSKSKGNKLDVNTLDEYRQLLKQKEEITNPVTRNDQYDKFMNLKEEDNTTINKWIKDNKSKITDSLNEDVDTVELKKLVQIYEKETGKKITNSLEDLTKLTNLYRSSEKGAVGISASTIGGFKSLGQTPANMLGRAMYKLRKLNDPNARVFENQIGEALRKGGRQSLDALYFSLMQQPQFRHMIQEDKGNESKP